MAVDIHVPRWPMEALSYLDILTVCLNWDHVVSRKSNILEQEILAIFVEKYPVGLFSVHKKTVTDTMMKLKALRQCLPLTRKVFQIKFVTNLMRYFVISQQMYCETFLVCCETFSEKPLAVKWQVNKYVNHGSHNEWLCKNKTKYHNWGSIITVDGQIMVIGGTHRNIFNRATLLMTFVM